MAGYAFSLFRLLTIRIFLYLSVMVVILVMFGWNVTFACGPSCELPGQRLELTTPLKGLLNLLIEEPDSSGELNSVDAFRFLYPFKLVNPEEISPLWNTVYDGRDRPKSFSPPDTTALESALQNGKWKTAHEEAQKIVDQVLDMPGLIAQDYQPALIQAVEFLEIEPLLQKIDPELIRSALWSPDELSAEKSNNLSPEILDILDMRHLDRMKADATVKAKPNHPRSATLRFVALRNEFGQKVPDGWQYDIQKQVPSGVWRELEASVDSWLKDYPKHPLADLVLLWKARIYFFEGDEEGAWQVLLSVYPRRLPRVLYDMRYLLMQNLSLNVINKLRQINDPVLFTGLLTTLHIEPQQWDHWWKVSEENSDEPWAVNLQERLLAEAHRFGKLPALFPKKTRNPSQLWGRLRAAALMKACKWADAEKQIFSLVPDEERALLAAMFYLRSGLPLSAVQVGDLPALTRLYLVRVIYTDKDLSNLKTQDKNSMLAKEIIQEKGVRLTQKGEWTAGSRVIQKIDPTRSKLWMEVERLKTDDSKDSLLTLARFFRTHSGELFYDGAQSWQSTLRARYGYLHWDGELYGPRTENGNENEELPWSKDQELKGIERHYLGSTELWLALQAYVDWLETAKPSPEKREVVKEAESCYKMLTRSGNWGAPFWAKYLSGNPVIEKLRGQERRSELLQPVL